MLSDLRQRFGHHAPKQQVRKGFLPLTMGDLYPLPLTRLPRQRRRKVSSSARHCIFVNIMDQGYSSHKCNQRDTGEFLSSGFEETNLIITVSSKASPKCRMASETSRSRWPHWRRQRRDKKCDEIGASSAPTKDAPTASWSPTRGARWLSGGKVEKSRPKLCHRMGADRGKLVCVFLPSVAVRWHPVTEWSPDSHWMRSPHSHRIMPLCSHRMITVTWHCVATG